jgi:hypothetical protein
LTKAHNLEEFYNTQKSKMLATVDMNNAAGSPIEGPEDKKANT